MPKGDDHKVNFCISPEKRENQSRYVCSDMNDLHELWHVDPTMNA